MSEDGSASSGKEQAARWAASEKLASLKWIARGMLLLALVLLLGAVLDPNPAVPYSAAPGLWGTLMNLVSYGTAVAVKLASAACRFLSVASVVPGTSHVPDAILYGLLGGALLAWKNRVPALLLLLLAGAGLAISALRMAGVLAGDSGNVVVSILAVIGAFRASQLATALHR